MLIELRILQADSFEICTCRLVYIYIHYQSPVDDDGYIVKAFLKNSDHLLLTVTGNELHPTCRHEPCFEPPGAPSIFCPTSSGVVNHFAV